MLEWALIQLGIPCHTSTTTQKPVQEFSECILKDRVVIFAHNGRWRQPDFFVVETCI